MHAQGVWPYYHDASVIDMQDSSLEKQNQGLLATAQVLKVCRTPGPTACLKMLSKVCLKSWRRKISMAALNLQPSDLCSNTYRSLPGGQVFFSLCIYIQEL